MRRGGRAIVIGGGLAGLACARELGNACTLLEAEDRLGGLVRTDVIDGFSFDWTGHWLHAREPEMRKLIQERWLGGNLLEVQRRARIYSEGVWTTFPYQFHLHGLPARTISDCVLGFIDATLGPGGEELRSRPLANAAEFILRHLGEGFARHFMFPYNEKLFTVACEDLSPEWGGRFIPRPSLEEVVNGAGARARGVPQLRGRIRSPRRSGNEAVHRASARGSFPLRPDRSRRRRALARPHHSGRLRALRSRSCAGTRHRAAPLRAARRPARGALREMGVQLDGGRAPLRPRGRSQRRMISIVIPVYNEARIVRDAAAELCRKLDDLRWE